MLKRSLSLKKIWLVLILLVGLVPLFIASIWFAQMSYDTKLSYSLALEKQKSLSLRKNIESEIYRIKTVLLNKADPLSFLMADEAAAKDLTLVNTLLKQVIHREKVVRGVMLLSTDSKAIAVDASYLNMATDESLSTTTLQSIGESWGLIDVFEQPEVVIPSRGGVYISSPEAYRDTLVFTISVPVGKPVEAVLVAQVDFNFLWEQAAQRGDTESGVRDYLVDSRGSLVSSVKGSEYQRGDSLTHLEIVRAALGRELWREGETYVGVLKKLVYGSVVNIPILNWSLISEVNASQVTQPIWNAFYKILLFIVPSMAVFIGFIWLLTRKTLVPIQELYTAVDQVAKGEYKLKFSLSGISELDALSLSFNEMSEARQQAETLLREREQNLSITLNSIGDGVIATDAVGNVTRMNSVAEKLTGWALHDALGKPVNDIFPIIDASTRETIQNPVDKVLLSAQTVHLSNHTTLISKDGSEYHIADSAAPILDEESTVLGMVLVFNDVTEQYHLREQAALAHRTTQELFDGMQTMAAILNVDGEVVFTNSGALEVLGLKLDDLLGVKLWCCDWFNYDAQVVSIIENDYKQACLGESVLRDIQLYTQQGLLWIEFSIHSVLDENGQLKNLIAEGRDITERKRLEVITHQADEILRASKKQLQNVINAAKLGYWDWNCQTHEHIVNDIWLEMLGLSRGDIKNNSGDWSSRVHPDDADKVNAVVKRSQYAGASYVVDFRMKHSDGHWVWIEGSGGVVEYDEINKVPLRMCGTHQDISHRKELENEVHASLQHLKLYREQTPLAAIEWNVDFQVEDWNQAAESMFGYTLGEIKGRDFNMVLPDSAKVNVSEIWQGLMKQTGGSKNINENLTKDGRIILCEWHNKAIVDESGKVVGAASVVLDITQLKEQQVQLQRAQKMDALGKLVGGIAHDFNNMLGVIIGYTDLMQMKFSNIEGLQKYIGNIAKASDRGRKLTQRMLNFSKRESSEASAVSMSDILIQQRDLLSKAITALITIEYDLCDSGWLVWVDSGELEDVLLNVSINAQYAMPNGGTLTFTTKAIHLSPVEAKFLGLAENDYLKLSVCDTGCGMDDELMSKIFDPFFTTKGSYGTGLGLSQVYGFMERSGGIVNVYSEEGSGSEFSFYFPRYHGINERDSQQDLMGIDGAQGDGETILIVDDEPSLRELAAEILSLAGYRILMASDGGEALDVLASQHVDLVLSDVIMPQMDGYQLANHIESQYPKVKIQLVSGYSDNRHLDVVNDQLYKTLLHKPYSSLELTGQIKKLLDELDNG